MDWFAWLSKTDLDPALVYEFGLVFSQNELQAEDIPHFDHEFLQSMGISIAKHRLEILKVSRKDASRPAGKPFSGIFSRTKRSVVKYLGRLISREESAVKDTNEPVQGAGENRRVALTRKHNSDKEFNHRSLALSGPLDGQFQHNYLTAAHRSPKLLSGPLFYGSKSPTISGSLDVKSHEEAILALRSPKFSGPMDGWAVSRSPRLSGIGDRQLATSRSLKSSGPIERAANRSPRVSSAAERAGPSPRLSPRVHGNGKFDREMMRDGFDEQSLWAKLFHDMKPT